MEFPVTIESQADFDKLVSSRLEREKAKQSELEASLQSAEAERGKLTEQLETMKSEKATLETEVSEFQAARERDSWRNEIVKGSNVPANVLKGETREELESHFEALKPLVTAAGRPPVDSQGEMPEGDLSRSEEAAFMADLFGSND